MADQRFNLSVLFKVLDQATAPLRKVGAAFSTLNRKVKKAAGGFKSLKAAAATAGAKLKEFGQKTMARMPLVLGAFAATAVRTRIKFETSMNKVAAVTRATGTDFTKLKEQAKELGITTQFSASQSAEAMTFLAMAGLNTQQVMKTLPGTLQLAAAGGLDLATAADLVTNVMTSMGKKVEDIGKINDILAETAASANTNVLQLGEAFRPVAGFASSAGVSVAQLSAMLGKMADSGERGSIAGTLLRQSFNELLKNGPKMNTFLNELGVGIEDFTDESGKLKNFDVLMKKIGKAGVAPAKIMRAFGRQGGRAVLLLSKRGKDLKNFTKQLEDSEGTAKKMAETMMKGLPGAAKATASAFEGLQLAFTKGELGVALEASLNRLADTMRNMSREINNVDFGPFLSVLGFITDVLKEVIGFSLQVIKLMTVDLANAWASLGKGVKNFFGFGPGKETAAQKEGGFVGSAFDVGDSGKILGEATKKAETETVVKVLVQSTKDSQATVEGVDRKKGSAKTIVKNTTLLSPFMTAGGRVNQ